MAAPGPDLWGGGKGPDAWGGGQCSDGWGGGKGAGGCCGGKGGACDWGWGMGKGGGGKDWGMPPSWGACGKGMKGGKGGCKAPKQPQAPLSAPPVATSAKVFVGALPSQVTEESVRQYFQEFGEIRELKMMCHENGVSKGFCFVTYTDMAFAQKVLDNYGTNSIDGKWVDCRPAQSGDSGGGGGGGGGGTGGQPAPLSTPPVATSAKVFVGGLPSQATEEPIRQYFQQFGEIAEVKMMYHDNWMPKSFCFVTFTDMACAQKVFDNYTANAVGGKWVDCRPAQSGDRGGMGGGGGMGGFKGGCYNQGGKGGKGGDWYDGSQGGMMMAGGGGSWW